MLQLLSATGGDGVGGIQIGLSGALVAALATVAVAVLGLAGVMYSARLSRGAADESTDIEARRLELEQEQAGRAYDAALIQRLNAEIERIERQGHDRAHEQAVRCRAIVTHLTEGLQVLVTTVRDEVEAEAARDLVDEGQLHLATDHQPDDTSGD